MISNKSFLFCPLMDCVAIPGEQLDLDWILMFLEEGYRFEGTRLDGRPFVLVQVKPMGIDSPTVSME
jgi:hypothetical protein